MANLCKILVWRKTYDSVPGNLSVNVHAREKELGQGLY